MPRQSYEGGYLADVNDLDEKKIDTTHRSFMDQGQKWFDSREARTDKNGIIRNDIDNIENSRERNEVMADIRKNLLAQMRSENDSSRFDATTEQSIHDKFDDEEMMPAIEKAKSKARKALIARAEYQLAISRYRGRHQTNALAEINSMISTTGEGLESARQKSAEYDAKLQRLNGRNGENIENDEDDSFLELDELSDVDEEDNEENGQGNEAEEEDVVLSELEVSKENVSEMESDLKKLRDIQRKIAGNAGSLRGSAYASFMRLWQQMERSKRISDELTRDVDRTSVNLKAKALEWESRRNEYREKTYLKHYRAFDNYAESYYKLTREIGDRALDSEANDAKKDIAEYTGVYDLEKIGSLGDDIKRNPYVTVTKKPEHVPKKAVKDGSLNAVDGNNRLIKYHRTMTFEAFAEGVESALDEGETTGPRIRLKMKADFSSYKAKRQYVKFGSKDTEVVDMTKEQQIADAEGLTLIADEKGSNNEYIYSDKSAKIHQVRKGFFTRQKMNGIVMGGRFISDDENARTMKDTNSLSALDSIPVINGISAIGNLVNSVSEQNMIDEERVRTAIRRSDFFRHVNAATIQYYAGYDVEGSFKNNIKTTEDLQQSIEDINKLEELKARKDQLDAQSQNEEADNADEEDDDNEIIHLDDLNEDDEQEEENGGDKAGEKKKIDIDNINLDELKPEDLTPKLYEKLKKKFDVKSLDAMTAASDLYIALTDGNADYANAAAALANEDIRANYDIVIGNKAKARDLAIMLLSTDSIMCWDVARRIAIDLGGSTKIKVEKYLPPNGEVMRAGLLNEFTTDRSFDIWDLSKSTRPDRLNMYMEDLEARRGGFFSSTNLKQSFFNGSLLTPISDLFTATVKDSAGMGWAANESFSSVFNAFNQNYISLISACSGLDGFNFAFLGVESIATIAGAFETDKNGNSMERARGNQMGAILTEVKLMYSLVILIRKIVQAAKNEQMAGKAKALLITTLSMKCLSLIGTMLNFVQKWITNLPAPVKAAFSMTFNIITIITSTFNIIAAVLTLIKTSQEINKIQESDKEMETALTDFQSSRKDKNIILNPGNLKNIDEEELATLAQKTGLAAMKNTQFTNMSMLARSRAGRERKMAGHSIAQNTIAITRGATGLANPVTAIPLNIMGQAAKFVAWVHGKLHDREHFVENIAMMLGDKKLAHASNFDAALKRETGIKNRHYLVDLARIFTAIDTHALINKPEKTAGEQALVITAMSPYMSAVNGEKSERFKGDNLQANLDALKKLKLAQIMGFTGGPANWRAVLRNSVM